MIPDNELGEQPKPCILPIGTRPVATQLERLENGINLLLQSHAGLEHKLEGIDTVQDAIRFEGERDRAHLSEKLANLTQAFVNINGHQAGLAERLGFIEAKLESTITTYSVFTRAMELQKARKPLKAKKRRKK